MAFAQLFLLQHVGISLSFLNSRFSQHRNHRIVGLGESQFRTEAKWAR
jgi:hypothetical protein